MKKIYSALIILSVSNALAQTPCENGMANGFPCNQMILQSHVSASELQGTEVNDIWGWTDPYTGKEYALVGLSDGVTFVDVSSPTSPIAIGKLIETHDHSSSDEILHGESSWRDIKVYKDHAFVVSDLNEEHGMQIFDLTQLRDFDGSTFQTFTQTARYSGIGSAHNIVINEETGFGYIVGISSGSKACFGGGLHILDLQNPSSPKYVGCFDDDGYTHDAQCVIYDGSDTEYVGMEICLNSNEDTFTIVNTSDKDDVKMISRTGYEDAGYTHQGWLSEDHNYFFMNDEFDEGNHGYNPRTIIWDVRDLDNPVHIGNFYNEAVSIDHNLYTHNGLIFESNYSSGLRVLDYQRVENAQLREVAFFDTQPQSDVIAYEGSWSNYPYFESGNIIVSDMANGLFVLRLDKKDPIASHPEAVIACSGTDQVFLVEVDEGNINIQWQVKKGVKFSNLAESASSTGVDTRTLTVSLNGSTVGSEYRAKLTSEDGSIYYSYPAMMNYEESPIADFSFSQVENAITFTNNSTNATKYLWDFGDGKTSEDENPIHEYVSGGSYSVNLSASNDCSTGTKAYETLIPLGILESDISIYPNPATDFINVSTNIQLDFKIFDLAGHLYTDGSISNTSKSINTSTLEEGFYLLIIESEFGEKLTKKIRIIR